jgi:hypothetical protein
MDELRTKKSAALAAVERMEINALSVTPKVVLGLQRCRQR